MAKKKLAAQAAQPDAPPAAAASGPSLIICRNKHWRYISSFHGPWLQLPPEILDSLAHQNYTMPAPRLVDPAVFYDIVKIRKAVDEAAQDSVRASTGISHTAASTGRMDYLGTHSSGSGPGSQLSKERIFKIRQKAVKLLSKAFTCDEVAASVATMQATSTVEDVGRHVLKRESNNLNAKYVHFFHEKIPSRAMEHYTPLDPLNEIISALPLEQQAPPLRTRALVRIFKQQYEGAALDLTQALRIVDEIKRTHKPDRQQLELASRMREEEQEAWQKGHRDWRAVPQLSEEDQPQSLEQQLLFNRAGVYLTLACQNVSAALDGLGKDGCAARKAGEMDGEDGKAMGENGRGHGVDANVNGADRETNGVNGKVNGVDGKADGPEARASGVDAKAHSAEAKAHAARLDARKKVKTFAKRALKDYTAFLAHFDYTPGLPFEITNEIMRRVYDLANGNKTQTPLPKNRLIELPDSGSEDEEEIKDADLDGTSHHAALIKPLKSRPSEPFTRSEDGWPRFPAPHIHPASALFAEKPPPDLPPFPTPESTRAMLANETLHDAFGSREAVTYHPLLTDALHSLLLAHALLQTSPTELLRHAHNAARLARIADGYPIFQAARSPARADWIEVLRRANNWLGLAVPWQKLCAPAPLPEAAGGWAKEGAGGSGGTNGGGGGVLAKEQQQQAQQQKQKSEESPAQRRERIKQESILDALSDDRVVDEETFQRAVHARERRAMEDEEGLSGPLGVKAPTARPEAAAATANGTATTETGTRTPTTSTTNTTPSSPTPADDSLRPPKRWAQDENGKEYPILTDRAEAIARWIREAPLSVVGAGGGGGRKKRTGRKKMPFAHDEALGSQAAVEGVAGLHVNGHGEEDDEEGPD